MSKQIKWENWLRFDNGSICKISVDGTDFRIANQRPFWKGWYSFKFKRAGLRYEIAIAIQSGDIVWIHGPFPAGKFPDIKIFRWGLKAMLLAEGEQAEADDGYKGEAQCIDLPAEGCFAGGQRQRKMKQRVRSRHETANGKFKNFGCLDQQFRHPLRKHKLCVNAVVTITQIGIRYGDAPLFQVRGYKTETFADLV